MDEMSGPQGNRERVLKTIEGFHSRFEGPNTIGNSRHFWMGFWIVLGILLIYPMLRSTYMVKTYSDFFVWVILALSLSIVWGYTGIFNFGQMATFALGGYTYGIIAINLSELTGGNIIGVLGGLAVPAIVMAAIGYFMFYGKVAGLFVAIITLVVTLILNLLFTRTSGMTIGEAQLGGLNGLSGAPSLIPDVPSTGLTIIVEYYLILIMMVGAYLGLRYLANSYYGYVMIAIREDQSRTEMFGYDIRKLKTLIFSGGAALGGLAGILYVSWSGFIDPTMFGIVSASLPIIWITVGGRATLLGSGIAAFFLQYTSHELGSLGSEYSYIFLGTLFILVILFFPEGIVPALHDYIVNWSSDETTQNN